MTAKSMVRDVLRTVRIRVWGWNKEEADNCSVVLNRVAEYVQSAYFNGLDEDDMVEDICDKFPAYFEDGEVEFQSDNTVLVVLAPVESD